MIDRVCGARCRGCGRSVVLRICLRPGAGHGESGWTARMIPLTVDGLICANSMAMLDSARRRTPVPGLARGSSAWVSQRRSRPTSRGLGHGLVGVGVWGCRGRVGRGRASRLVEVPMLVIRFPRFRRTARPRPGTTWTRCGMQRGDKANSRGSRATAARKYYYYPDLVLPRCRDR